MRSSSSISISSSRSSGGVQMHIFENGLASVCAYTFIVVSIAIAVEK
jgi:hypothetical protein